MKREKETRLPDAFLEWLLDELITGGYLQADFKPSKKPQNEQKDAKLRNGAKNTPKTHSERVVKPKEQN